MENNNKIDFNENKPYLAPHNPFTLEGHWQPWYDDRRDYSTNAPSYYDYLANFNHLIKSIVDLLNRAARRNVKLEDTNSINMTKINDWIDEGDNAHSWHDDIILKADVILSTYQKALEFDGNQYNLNNIIATLSDGLYSADYLPLLNALKDKLNEEISTRQTNDNKHDTLINSKQDKLIAGSGVTINNQNIISVTKDLQDYAINSTYLKHYNNIIPNRLSDLGLLDMTNTARATWLNGNIIVQDTGYWFPTIQVKGNEDVYISLYNISDPTKVKWRVKRKNGDGITEPQQFKGSSSDNVYYLNMYDVKDLTQNDDDVIEIRVDNRKYDVHGTVITGNDVLTIDNFMISKKGVPANNSDYESVYVDGSSPHKIENGSHEYPFKTIQRALDVKPNHVLIASGVYNENITAATRPTLKMTAIPPIYNHVDITPDNPKVLITNGKELTLTPDENDPTVLSAYQTYKPFSRLEKVFIKQSMPLIDSGGLLSDGYNVIVWEHSKNNETTRLVPVIDLCQCLATEGSFTYDGTKLYVHPKFSNDSKFIFTDAYVNKENERLADFRKIGELTLEGIDFKYSYDAAVFIYQCNRVNIKDCEASFSALSNGFATMNTNSNFNNCKGYFNRGDAFNFHGYGNVTVHECFGSNNYDDGCSHHDGTTGTIVGGEYAYNGKGGISPTYGADVYVKDVYSHHNKYGCYAVGETKDKFREVIHKNNIFINNTASDYLITNNYKINGINNRYNTIDGQDKYVTI